MTDSQHDLLVMTSALVVCLDPDGRIAWWNPACSEVSGYRLEEARGQTVVDLLIEPEEREAVVCLFSALCESKVSSRFATHWRTRTGELRYIVWSNDVLLDAAGRPRQILAIGIERTEAREAATRASTYQRRFERMLAISSDAVVVVDDDEVITSFNRGAEELFGYAAEEILGHKLDVLIPERFRAVHHEHVRRFAAEGIEARRMGEGHPDVYGLKNGGEEFIAEVAISKLDAGGERLFTAVLRDVTETRRRERQERFLSQASQVLSSSLEYAQTLKHVAQLAVSELADFCIIDLVQDGEVRRLKALHKDPAQAELALRFERMGLDRTRPHLVWPALNERRTVLLERVPDEYLVSIAQDEAHLSMLRELDLTSMMALPLIARDRLVGAIVLATTGGRERYDETSHRFAEALAARAALAVDNAQLFQERARAVRAREDVLKIVAHDLRSPLGSARIAATLLDRELPEQASRGRRHVATILSSVERAAHLISDLLDVARIEARSLSVDTRPTDVADVVRQVQEPLALAASEAALDLEVHVEGDLPPVNADPRRVQQILTNLVDNAVKFTPPGGRVTISAEPRDDHVVVSVQDTGPGLSPEQAERVFERYWQGNRRDDRGAGLGLPIVKGLVEAQRGRTWVESEEGRGSTFRFTLPVSDGHA